MQIFVLALLLAAIFGLFVPSAQTRLRGVLHGAPATVWAVPFLLAAVFAGASAAAGVFRPDLTAIVLVYLVAPVACVALAGAGSPGKPGLLDGAAIALLWFPLEFAGGVAHLIPRPVQGFLHSVAYGVAILLALILFLGFRSFPGMKYRWPERRRDWALAGAGYLTIAPVLVVVGIAIGFIPLPHGPNASANRMVAAVGLIFAGTALPEEILFRSLIQNLLMLRFGESGRTLLVASVIFGAAHLNNGGPEVAPNWRYAIEATIAGVAYGRVFQRSGSVVSSALLHMLVDWTKHFFF
jgi:membrane protease YdiL (CAAX protease family)